MGKLFYSKFLDESINRITIYGKSERVELINQLAAEAVVYFPLVIVTFAMPFEILNEKEVVAVKDVKQVKKKLKKKQGFIYLCKSLNGSELIPYSASELLELQQSIGDDICLFIRLGEPENKIKLYDEVLQNSLNICRIDFHDIKHIVNSMSLDKKTEKYVTHTEYIFKVFTKGIELKWSTFRRNKSKFKKYCFIDNIKDLFDENMVLPIARSIAEKGKVKVLYGDIYTYQLKDI